jgi:hypothetical protein
MAFEFVLPLRAAQGVLTIIILGLTSYVISIVSFSQVNFLLFCSIWTILVLAYLIITPQRVPEAAHKFAVSHPAMRITYWRLLICFQILGAEAVTMIFWFAGFIAAAVWLTDTGCDRGSPCRSLQAATVFGAFEW